MYIVFPRIRVRISVFALPIMLMMLWLEGALPFLVLILSAVLHELGHIAAMRFCGFCVRRIDILPMGAIIVCPEGIPDRDEVFIAVCGPLASLCCSLLSMLWFALGGSAISLFAVLVNLVLGVFNLLPVKKLDGGKALCCYLTEHKNEKTAKQICLAASVVSKLIFCLFAAVCIAVTDFNLGVMLLSAALLVQIIFD